MKGKNLFGLLLFGLLFFCVGLGMGAAGVVTLVRARAMLSWREVPATVLTCKLDRSCSSDSDTYSVRATYAYEVDGIRYTGDRVTLHTCSDNIGSFHQRTVSALRACQETGRPTVCWVNPSAPSEAILFRRPRPELLALDQLFLVAFGGIGLAVFVFAGVSLLLRREALRDGRQIPMSGRFSRRVVAVLAAVWDVYACWLLGTLWVVLAPEPVPWYFWSLAAVGAGLTLFAAVPYLRLWRFGDSVFELSPFPATVGGVVGGTLRIPARVVVPEGFALRLECFRRHTDTSGDENTTTTECVWMDMQRNMTAFEEGVGMTAVPVRFVVPSRQPVTAGERWEERVFWRLTATAGRGLLAYRAVFEVPVGPARTGKAEEASEPARGSRSLAQIAEGLGLKVGTSPDGGFELVCPAFLAKNAIALLGLLAGIFGAVCYVLWFVADIMRVVPIVFSLFEGLILWSFVDAAAMSYGLRVECAGGACVVWRKMLGLPLRACRVPFADIEDFRVVMADQSGTTQYYKVVLLRKSGGKLTALNHLQGRPNVQRLTSLLTERVRTREK